MAGFGGFCRIHSVSEGDLTIDNVREPERRGVSAVELPIFGAPVSAIFDLPIPIVVARQGVQNFRLQCPGTENTNFTPLTLSPFCGNKLFVRTMKLHLHPWTVFWRILASLLVSIYVLSPLSIKSLNTGCKCGCNEFICTCCQKAPHPEGMPCFSDYDCSLDDESNDLPPATGTSFFSLPVVPNIADYVALHNNGSPLPGYKRQLIKPPPLGILALL